jgi:hypothetical protein
MKLVPAHGLEKRIFLDALVVRDSQQAQFLFLPNNDKLPLLVLSALIGVIISWTSLGVRIIKEMSASYFEKWVGNQGCQIFLGPSIPNWKNITNGNRLYQTAINYTKWP